MTTVTLWLLISLGQYGASPHQVIERFATAKECERIANVLRAGPYYPAKVQCIEATVVRP